MFFLCWKIYSCENKTKLKKFFLNNLTKDTMNLVSLTPLVYEIHSLCLMFWLLKKNILQLYLSEKCINIQICFLGHYFKKGEVLSLVRSCDISWYISYWLLCIAIHIISPDSCQYLSLLLEPVFFKERNLSRGRM